MTEQATVAASQCQCGARFAPPRARCSECGQATTATRVAGEGTLLSWTVQRRPPEGFTPPLVVAIVALPGGVRAVAAGPATDAGLALDMAVRVREDAHGRLRFAPE